MRFDQIVVGNGETALNAALTASRRGDRVALVLNAETLNSGTQQVRELARGLSAERRLTLDELRRALLHVTLRWVAEAAAQLQHAGVQVFPGAARFVDGRTVAVESARLVADSIVLACGSCPATSNLMGVDGRQIVAGDPWEAWRRVPPSTVVVGAGAQGLDCAIVLAQLGSAVTVIDERASLFELCDGLMSASLWEAQSLPIAFRLNEEVLGIQTTAGGQVVVRSARGATFTAAAAVLCAGRRGRTDGLGLEEIGVGLDEHGRVWCDAVGQTWVPGIQAVGDVIGFQGVSGGSGVQSADMVDSAFQIVRQRRVERLPFLGDGVRERDFGRMQRLPIDVR